jgi:hypothetical protein
MDSYWFTPYDFFYVANPSLVSKSGLCLDGFVRVEHMETWVLMSMLLLIFMYFGSWWHSWMKRPGLTLYILVHETCSTLDMQLVLHMWLYGCLSLLL